MGCFVYSFPKPALSTAFGHLKIQWFLSARGITVSQRLISKVACSPGAWATIPKDTAGVSVRLLLGVIGFVSGSGAAQQVGLALDQSFYRSRMSFYGPNFYERREEVSF